MRTVQFERLRPDEIQAEKERVSIIYLPIGPLEWHGVAMPLGVDPIVAYNTALLAAQKTGGVVLPTLYCGSDGRRPKEMLEDFGFEDTDQYLYGMDITGHPVKSLYWPEELFGTVVRSYLDLLLKRGYKLIVLANGHGADSQVGTLRRLATEYTATQDASVVLAPPMLAHFDDTDEDFTHAGRMETSLQMYFDPDSVDLGRLPPPGEKLLARDYGIADDGFFSGKPPADKMVQHDPRGATPELGERYAQAAADAVAKQVLEAYAALA